MDLTTTRHIKRKIINIIPSSRNDVTDCTVTLSNWLYRVPTEDRKIRISSFFMNNTAIPCFIPEWTENLPPTGWQGGTTVTTSNNTLTPDTLGYYFNLYNPTTNTSHGGIINMDALRSEYPTLRPPIHPTSEYSQLSNKYYWFFNTTLFLDLIIKQINDVINANSISSGIVYGIQLIKTSEGYGLLVPNTVFDAGYSFQFSKSLIDLFQFKAVKSSNSDLLYTIQFNATPRNYFVENLGTNQLISQACAFVASRYIPDTWFPFDQMLFRVTGLPIDSENVYDNSNRISQNYENIMLTYKLVNANPDGIYNFFTSEIDPGTGWVSFDNKTNGMENFSISCLLRLKRTKDLLPYQIKPNENFYFTVEDIQTE